MKKLLHIYPYLAACLLSPLAAYLWWQEYQNLFQMLLAWLIPVLWAYIVPGVGTNICKVWEVKSKFNIGRFRIQHGFVFGSATALLSWLTHQYTAQTILDIFISAIILCSVIGFWNILYDIVAIKAGILFVYNEPWANNKGAEAIVLDYAPWIFGGFGFCYGLTISGYEYIVHHYGQLSYLFFTAFFILGLCCCIVIPVSGVMNYSYKKYGHAGTKPIIHNNKISK